MVYLAVTLDLPIFLLFGYTWPQIALEAAVGWVIAVLAIHFAFVQSFRSRRRTAYPGLLIVNLGDTVGPPEAAAEALFTLEGLLETQSSFLALRYDNGLRVLASRGMTSAEAQQVMETHAGQFETATENSYPLDVIGDSPGCRAVFVPIVALKRSIGMLYLAAAPGKLLGDRNLLADIGGALGLSLDNLRQKEQLLQKESRLRSVVMGAPIVLFSVDTAGAITFIQGQGIAALNLDPENIIGRPVWEIWAAYPEIIQSFRRAFAGDSVTSLAAITLAGQDRVFEYRLAPERDEHGRVTGVICIATDVTQRNRAEDALRESERALTTLLSNLPGYAFRVRNDDGFTLEYVSDGIFDITGHTAAEFISGSVGVQEVAHPDDRKMIVEAAISAVESRELSAIEYRIVTAAGETKWVWGQSQVVVDEDSDAVIALEGFVSDITERKRAEHALAESEERHRDLFENARDAMFTYNLRGRMISANRRMTELTGYTNEEFLALNLGQVIATDYHLLAAEALKRVFNGDSAPYELEIRAKDGRRIPLEITSRIILGKRGEPKTVQAIGRDITERKQAEETIRRLAYHDGLTSLPNRTFFENRLRLALARARREHKMLAVMFLDLDSFKVVNDTLGHGAGDKLLQAVAHDLATLVRDGDTVARVGGDEFTLLLAGIEGPEDATEIAQRILECLRQSRVINGTEFRTTGSIGITTYPADGDEGETLLRNADTAMYRAKERGRDNYQLYTASMNAKMMERIAVERDLRHALDRDELTLFYQPIVVVETGVITGAEALLRWRHPQRGIVPPDEFIPLAEETGLILEIGEWVLRQACRQVRQWREQGLAVDLVAVNLSARQLQQEDLVERIAGILRESGVSPDSIQLEITEGAVLKNVDYAIAMLRQLGGMGIQIALDDFGTGYSSLTYLKRFPIDAVKIDRSFVRDLEHDASDATIVSTVIAMAESMHLNVIAEGVETENQLEFLRQRGCKEYQGYLFARPMPPEEFATLLRAASSANARVVPVKDAA
jgi:diguanylate cyclase (GGDEF)-like protein/PAS domain S-box-containing protein